MAFFKINLTILNSEIQRAKMINPGSPFLTTTKPDIPLRQPLEEENKSKRKAAKEIFEKEKWEKVIQNKIKMQHDHDEKLEKFKKVVYSFQLVKTKI